MDDLISRQTVIDAAMKEVSDKRTHGFNAGATRAANNIKTLPSAQPVDKDMNVPCTDAIDRQAAIDTLMEILDKPNHADFLYTDEIYNALNGLPSVQPERKWISCSNPPKHHKDVIVRGIEAIGSVTVHKVMQWDVDTWRPADYAPSVMWKEWSEI